MTLAVSLASNQAAAMEHHWAYFAGIWETGPRCLCSVISFPIPIHLGLECWMLWTETVIQMKSVMGTARSVCWSNACWVVRMNSKGLRPTVNINFLASLTEVALQTLHVRWVECDAGWVLDDGNEGVSDLRKSGPCIPCCLFVNSKHRRCYITSCEWMEEEKCLAAMRCQLLRYVMNWNFSECLPWPKSDPQLLQF